MSIGKFVVAAQARTGSGTAASRRARHAGQVPCVIYGGGEEDQYILVDHNKIMHQLEVDAFHSSLIQIELDGDLQRAILRDVQMHPWKMQVLHLDFQRVSRKDTIVMSIPVHLVGADEAPGVITDKGILTQGINSIEVSCLGSDLPEYLDVNVSALEMGGAVHLSDLELPKGVTLAHPVEAGDEDDYSVASVLASKKPQSEEGEEGEAAEAAAEGDAE